MIIANYPYGRLGNQLQLAAHLMTFALMENKTICLQYLQEHAKSFPYFDSSPLRAFPKFKENNKFIEKIVSKIIPKLNKLHLIPEIDFLNKNQWIFFDRNEFFTNKELIKLKKSWLCTIKAWRLRSTSQINQYRSRIQAVFTPRQEILDQGRYLIASLESEIVIGVHIRWGDYKTAAPELYHGIEIYRKRMLEAQNLFPGKKVGFIVCTEEQQEIHELQELHCIFPKNNAMTDLYTLAQTQYIIASASTFSEWAAYWGNVGIFRVENPNVPISHLGDFMPVDLIVNL